MESLTEKGIHLQNPIEQYPGYLLRVVSQKYMGRLAEKLNVLELRVSEATVLRLIEKNRGIRQSQIGNQLNIARANMAPLVRKLEERGFVRKDPIDGRSYGLSLTNKGVAITNDVKAIMSAHEKGIENTIPESIRKQFLDTLVVLAKSDEAS